MKTPRNSGDLTLEALSGKANFALKSNSKGMKLVGMVVMMLVAGVIPPEGGRAKGVNNSNCYSAQFASDLRSPQTVEKMRQRHKSYLRHPLPIYSKGGEEQVRFFNVPPSDMEALMKEMGDDFGGFRIYLGYDEEEVQYHFILVGVSKATGENFLKDGFLFNDFTPCPNRCPQGLRTTDLNQ